MSIFGDMKDFQIGPSEEVITSGQSVCLTPFRCVHLDEEVVAFAKEHGIEITDEESYQYACHVFDKVYDA